MKFPIVKISNKKRSVFISIFPICNFIAFLSYNICSQGPHSLDIYCITVRAILPFYRRPTQMTYSMIDGCTVSVFHNCLLQIPATINLQLRGKLGDDNASYHPV